MVPFVVLNDGETYTSIKGSLIVDTHGEVYSLTKLWHSLTPIQRQACLVGQVYTFDKLDKLVEDARWP